MITRLMPNLALVACEHFDPELRNVVAERGVGVSTRVHAIPHTRIDS